MLKFCIHYSMKKTLKLALLLAASFLGQMTVSSIPSIGVAFAKPPDWAPAHGYRRKHGGDDHDNDDEDRRKKYEVREILVSRYEEVFRTLDINRDGRISRSAREGGDLLFARA